MNQAPLTQKAWTYIAECLRLLYWAFFKPFTLERRLHDINPKWQELSNRKKLSEFITNPHLHRYARQILWLIAVIPLPVTVLGGAMYSFVTGDTFHWFKSGCFLLGWFGTVGGVWFVWVFSEQPRRWLGFLIPTILVAALLVLLLTNDMQPIVPTYMETARLIARATVFGMAFGIAGAMGLRITFGMAVGMMVAIAGAIAGGMLFGIGREIVFEIASGITGAIAGAMACGMAFGIAFGIAGEIAFGITGGIAFGMITINLSLLILIISATFFVRTTEVIYGGIAGQIPVAIAFVMAYILGFLRIYFWIPELLWMGLLTLCTPPAQRAQRLRYLPPYFDELIYLPLPFVDRWIVDAYRTDREAAREMVDYLISLTYQQKVAAQAMVGIAVDRLVRCERLSDMVAITDELEWIPSPPPPAVGAAFITFLEISRDARAATQATTPYRERELLELPIKSLENLRKQLAFEQNAALARTYSRIVARWLRILERARRTLEERVRQASEIPQAYVAGPALDPIRAQSRFKGRIDLFREIETFALQALPPILLLRGGRRTGKSSTLNYLPRRVGSQIVPLVVDVQGIADATTLTGLAESMATQMIDMAHSTHNLTLPQPDVRALARDPFPALRKWMRNVEKTVAGKRLLLCLDEFERLEEVIRETGSRAPLNFLRHIMQHRHQWILLFSSSHTLDELAPYWSDYLINTRNLHISYLDEPDARELITQPIKNFPDIYQPATVDAIIQLTRCQPYFVQLVCSAIVEHLNKDNKEKRRRATPQDVQAIIPRALATADHYFNELWKNILTNEERQLTQRIAQGEQATAEEQKTLRGLVRKEVLEHKDGTYRFQVPLVEAFVKEMAIKEGAGS